jgi:uncharacterized repeat protein (TIGR03803 family)
MKTYIKNLFLLPALIAGLGLIPAGRMTAQTFTTLWSFTAITGPEPSTNSDGAIPQGGLILSGSTLYGTASYGGSSGWGTVFKVNTDGTSFTNLYSFGAAGYSSGAYTNSEGIEPYAGLILSGDTLYGTAHGGGSSGNGTVFKLNTDGKGFKKLRSFNFDSDGAYLWAGLILSGNTLYGTSAGGGNSGNGTVFAVNTDGTGFTNLHSFNYDSDGAYPRARLILSGNTLYGTAFLGGSSGYGTVFAMHIDGTGFTNLHSFTAISGPFPTNSDGANPYAGLILSGNTLYGTAANGGSSGMGTVFKVNTNGTGFTTLYSFTATSGTSSTTNSDGANPHAGLILSGNTLYGTAFNGGSSGYGTVFAVTTNGTGFMNLHSFADSPSEGARPFAGLVLSDNTLYGTTQQGGSSGHGTVFSLSFAPQLTIIASSANIILTWPTNVAGFDYTGFTLQSTTNLVSPAVWSTVSPGPVVFNGQNTVTNPISGGQKFYRLSH